MVAVTVRAQAPVATRQAGTSPRAVRATSTPAKPVASVQQQKLMAAVTSGVAATMATPLMADASTMTPSLASLLNSVVAGGLVLAILFGAVTTVASFDRLSRR